MPAKRKVIRRMCKNGKKQVRFCAVKPKARARKVRGKGLFSWIKDKALPWIKKRKLFSKGANFLSSLGVPYAGTVGKVAGTLGYGKRTDMVKKYGKKGLVLAKKHKAISRSLRHLATTERGKPYAGNLNKAANFAAINGYGLGRTGSGLNRTGRGCCKRKKKN